MQEKCLKPCSRGASWLAARRALIAQSAKAKAMGKKIGSRAKSTSGDIVEAKRMRGRGSTPDDANVPETCTKASLSNLAFELNLMGQQREKGKKTAGKSGNRKSLSNAGS